MKIKLEPVQHYNASVNGVSLGTFEVRGEWNGMVELRRRGGALIVDLSMDFVLPGDGPREADLVKASPNIMHAINEATNDKPQSEHEANAPSVAPSSQAGESVHSVVEEGKG